MVHMTLLIIYVSLKGLKALSLDHTTPVEALTTLAELRTMLQDQVE